MGASNVAPLKGCRPDRGRKIKFRFRAEPQITPSPTENADRMRDNCMDKAYLCLPATGERSVKRHIANKEELLSKISGQSCCLLVMCLIRPFILVCFIPWADTHRRAAPHKGYYRSSMGLGTYVSVQYREAQDREDGSSATISSALKFASPGNSWVPRSSVGMKFFQ